MAEGIAEQARHMARPIVPYQGIETQAIALMQRAEFERAAAVLRRALRSADEFDDEVILRMKTSLDEAEGAMRALTTRSTPSTARASADGFSASDRKFLKSVTAAETTELAGVGGARRIDRGHGKDKKPFAAWKPASRDADFSLDGIGDYGQLFAELLHNKIGTKLGLPVPHIEPLVLDGKPGFVSKWIPGTTELDALSAGARAAHAKQLARFRPMQVLIGNWDTHAANFMVDGQGRLWAIDAGESMLINPTFRPGDVMRQHRISAHGFEGQGDSTANWMRFARDATARFGKYLSRPAYAKTWRLEEFISGRDMKGSLKAIANRLDDRTLGSIVDEVIAAAPGVAPHRDRILRTLLERRQLLQGIIEERWPGAGS